MHTSNGPLSWLPVASNCDNQADTLNQGCKGMKRDRKSHVEVVLSSCHDRRGDNEVYILIIRCLIVSSSQTSEAHRSSKQPGEV